MTANKILIVEDEAIIGMELQDSIQNLGYEVTAVVNSGEKALQSIEMDRPDLILMDIRIKGEYDGIDTAEQIKNRFGIPVVFSTAYLDEGRIERAKITMPFGYVLKPIQQRDLKITLEMALYVAKVEAEKREADEKLLESQILFSEIFEHLPVTMQLFDPDGYCIRANAKFGETFGVRAEEIVGKYNILKDENLMTPRISALVNEIFFDKKTNKWEAQFDVTNSADLFGITTTKSKEIYVETIGYPVLDSAGNLKYVVMHTEDITDRKQVEESLRKLSTAVEQSPASVVITDLSGAIEYVNPAFEKLTGYTLEEAIGENPRILKSGDQSDAFYKEMWDTITAGKEWNGFFHNKKKTGDLFWESATIAPIRDNRGKITNYIGIKKDITEQRHAQDQLKASLKEKETFLKGLEKEITERKQAEEELKKSEERYRRIIETAEEGIWLVNNKWETEFVNAQMAEMLGYAPEEMIGKHLLSFMDEQEQLWAKELMARREQGINEKHDFKFQRRDGTDLWAIVSTNAITTDNGEFMHALAMVTDITLCKEAEDQIKASLKEKETLLQEIHHRVKNNMNAVSSLLSLHENSTQNEEVKKALQESQGRVYAMSAVHEALYNTKNLAEIDLMDYLNKLFSSLLQTYSVNPGKVQFKIDGDDVRVGIDKASPLGLTFNELISNALKYAFPGDRRGNIEVTLQKQDDWLALTIQDDGIGMPEGFDWKSGKTMGLRLVVSLVENQLGGSIEMDNKNGTRFTLHLNTEE